MNLLKLIFLFLIIIYNPLWAKGKGYVIINGNIKNASGKVYVEDMSEMQNLIFPNTELGFIPDSVGAFKIKFFILSPNYYRIGRNILYLSPGDSLHMHLDFKNPLNARFEGTNNSVAFNQYLTGTPYPKGGSFLESGDSVKYSIDSTILSITTSAKKDLIYCKELKSFQSNFMIWKTRE